MGACACSEDKQFNDEPIDIKQVYSETQDKADQFSYSLVSEIPDILSNLVKDTIESLDISDLSPPPDSPCILLKNTSY